MEIIRIERGEGMRKRRYNNKKNIKFNVIECLELSFEVPSEFGYPNRVVREYYSMDNQLIGYSDPLDEFDLIIDRESL